MQKWGALVKVGGVILTMLGTSSGAYIQASSEAKETADVGYRTMAARVASLEQAANYLDAELSLLKAREILAAHNVAPAEIAKLREIFAKEGLDLPPATSKPAEAVTPKRRRPSSGFGGGFGRVGGGMPPVEGVVPEPEMPPDYMIAPEVLAEIADSVTRARDTKLKTARPQWLDNDVPPEMPMTLDEAARQKVWLQHPEPEPAPSAE